VIVAISGTVDAGSVRGVFSTGSGEIQSARNGTHSADVRVALYCSPLHLLHRVSSTPHLPRFVASIARRLRSVIDGSECYFDGLASLSFLASLSISRHVCNST
jgi:hypothetical protein